jgi:hypothetical protein
MEIDEYRLEFLNSLRHEASLNANDVDDQFVNTVLNQLEELGELVDPYPFSCDMRGTRGRSLAFDAYGYDDADSSIVLLIGDFQNTVEKTILTNSRIDELFNKMKYFIEEANDGNIKRFCDDSDPIIDITKEFKKRIGVGKINTEVLKFKFFIITNSILSTQVKSVKKEDILERPVELNLWTLERFFQAKLSNTFESIQVNCEDFGFDGVQCIKANLGNTNAYDSYLAIVPGKFLADLYLKHGSRLLEGNVRAFLSVRGKVNRKIRETIIGKHPENFFTYNNGISVVVHSITLSSDKKKIVNFSDFQIINGGQTTASLASAKVKKEASLENMSKIYVPMKLTVLNVDHDMTEEEENKSNEIIQQISKSANCQNPVSDADFFSNDPFHVIMETMSLKIMAPPVNGRPYGTIWYYERSKGRWEQEQMKMTEAQRDKYKSKSPKSQVVKKEKLAKCLNAIYMNPHTVCEGSANNMKAFANTIESMYEQSKDSINEFFFKKSIASVILFDSVDRIVNNAPWYPKGGNKAQIVPYTIAKIIQSIPAGYELDWILIWQKQILYQELVHQVEIVAEQTHHFLCDSDGVIVREHSKKASTWKKFRDNYEITLTSEFISTLIDTGQLKDEAKAAAKEHRFSSDIELEVEVFNKGYSYWMNFNKDLEKEQLLSSGDRDFIKSIAKYVSRGSLPTKAQIKRLFKIINKAEDEGYIMLE